MEYKTLIEKSFENAENHISKLPDEILTMEGMSGIKTRHFYNNLCEDSRYLEIGLWKGSTLCSAMYGNKSTIIGIDNWSEFGGPKDEFLINFEKFKGENNVTILEQDCFTVDKALLPKFNIYMYDGDHLEGSHYKALSYFYECLDDTFIYIVDDWNWDQVRKGTEQVIKDLNLTIFYEKEIRTTHDGSHPEWGSQEQKEYHNGMYVAVLQKSP